MTDFKFYGLNYEHKKYQRPIKIKLKNITEISVVTGVIKNIFIIILYYIFLRNHPTYVCYFCWKNVLVRKNTPHPINMIEKSYGYLNLKWGNNSYYLKKKKKYKYIWKIIIHFKNWYNVSSYSHKTIDSTVITKRHLT